DPAPVRAAGRPSPDARGSGAGVRGHSGADPADRIEDAVEASPPLAVAEAPRLPGVAGLPGSLPGRAFVQVEDRVGCVVLLAKPLPNRRSRFPHPLLDDREPP